MLTRSFLTLLSLLLLFTLMTAPPALGDESDSPSAETEASTPSEKAMTPKEITALFGEVNTGWKQFARDADGVMSSADQASTLCHGDNDAACTQALKLFLANLQKLLGDEEELQKKYQQASTNAKRVDGTLILAVDTNAQLAAFEKAVAVRAHPLYQATMATIEDVAEKRRKKH